jgi:UDP:flavonoid glycosyltransferase YjiC (YdhE family)
MSRILCVWELGADFGHMSRFLPLALKLRERGHEVVFALKDLSNAEAILGRHGFTLLQAPIWTAPVPGLPKPPLSYTEILFRFGFLNKSGLTGMLKGWRELYALVKPDLMLADHSPTALLASRGLPFKRCLIGTGFFSPPRVSPFPNMRTWLKIPPERLPDGEKNVLQTANAVLAGFGVKPMNALFDMFDVDEDFLCTFPELDHYADRGPARYWSPVFAKDHGQDLKWPEPRQGKRVFAYLKPRYRDYEKILGLLRQVKGTVLVFSPGMSKAMTQKYQSPRMIISTQPIKLSGITAGCDLAICHAGPGTCAAMLLAGVPLLLLPTQLEQYMAARRVLQLGAGLMVTERPPDDPKGQAPAAAKGQEPAAAKGQEPAALKPKEPDYRMLLTRLLGRPAFAERAKAFAARHADFDQSKQCESMAQRIEELVKQ